MENYWLTWTEIKEASKGRGIVFFGRSEEWIPKSLKHVTPEFIVDSYNTEDYEGINTYSPTDIDDQFIVITSGAYLEIIPILEGMGLKAGKDFACCPEYRDWYHLEKIRNYSQTVYVACSDRINGGIYKYDLATNSYERIVKGSFRQMIRVGEIIYAIEYVECILYVISIDLEVSKISLHRPGFCGLAYDKKYKRFLIINAIDDTITVLNQLLETEYVVHYSRKGTDCHHLNDITVEGDYAYVSYFSHVGNWRSGIFDGGISEYRLDDLNTPPTQVVSGLWKPHSITFIDGDLSFVDSMRRDFYITTQQIVAKFQGFIRGLTYDDSYIYIGQSETMYMSQQFGKDNIMLNAGFYLFNRDKKVSRFYSMPDIQNVHDLLI